MAIAPERVLIQTHLEAACASHARWAELTQDQRATIVRRAERSCFREVITSCTNDGIDRLFTDSKFKARYSATCARLMMNLREANFGSSYLIEGLIDGTIDVNNVGAMTSAELCPAANRELREMIKARQNQQLVQKVCRKYTCRKCRKNETTTETYQGRGSDESSNESITCINCGHHWRIY